MTAGERLVLGELMDILVAAQPKVHYRQSRPMRTINLDNRQELLAALASPAGIAADCSESIVLLCHVAGCKSPMGKQGYTGNGNTETLLESLPHYTHPADAMTGAIVVLGADQPLAEQHACMVRSSGPDPILFSHGSEDGPIYIHLSQEQRAHKGATVFLNVASL